MRHRSGVWAIALTACFTATLAGIPSAPAATVDSADIDVTVTNLRSAKGKVIACLTPYAEGFPKCGGPRSVEITVPADAAQIHFKFPAVAPGRYAIALLHDENGNGKMDKSLMLIPKEGYGFSRDAPVRMAPPKFEAAAFDVNGEPVRQTIRMRYMV